MGRRHSFKHGLHCMAMLTSPINEFLKTLGSMAPYKEGKGLYVRYGTLAGILLLAAMGAHSLYSTNIKATQAMRIGLPVVVTLIVGWLAYRAIHHPPFAEFLISTENEIQKVYWPAAKDIWTSTIVVLIVAIFFTLFMYGVDWLWQFVLSALGILKLGFGLTWDNPNA